MSEYVAVQGTVMKMTKKAILFKGTDNADHWIPMSCIFEDDLAEIDEGVVGEINVATWFYEREME